MKLHLPSGLRKALLACLAALALPATSLPTTIASASGISALAFLFSAANEAQGQEYTWEDAYGSHTDNFSGTVFRRMDSASNPGDSGNTSLGTLELADTSNNNAPVGEGNPSLGKFWNNNANVLTDTLQITKLDGEAGEVTITCDWSGNMRLGGLIVDADDVSYRIGRPAGDGRAKQAIYFQAAGEQLVKMYIGASTNLVGGSVNVNGNSDWKIAKGKSLQFTGNADSTFTIAEGVSIDLSSYGAAEGAASVSIEMGLNMSNGSGLTVENGVDLSITGNVTSTGNALLTVEDGASVTLSGSQTSVSRLQLRAGSNLTSVNPLTINSISTVSGGVLYVEGKLGVVDNNEEAVLTVDGGGSVTVGSLGGTGAGHAGRLKVGGVSTFGTLTVGTQANSYTGDAFMAKSLYVQNSADDAGEGSVVAIYGNANFYNYIQGQDAYAMIVDGKSTVTIDGTLHGHSNNLRSVKLDNGGELSVKGAVTFGDNYGLEVANGTATLSGGVTASSITMSQGRLTLGGVVNVDGVFAMNGGTANVTDGLTANAVTLGGGTLRLGGVVSVGGAFTMSGGTANVTNGLTANAVTLAGGTLTLGGVMNVRGTFTVSGGTANVTSGLTASTLNMSGETSEVTVGGTVTVSSFAGRGGTVKIAGTGATFEVGDGLTLDTLEHTLDTQGHTLTKSGGGTLKLSRFQAHTQNTAGTLEVQAGKLVISGLADAADGNSYIADEVLVRVGSSDRSKSNSSFIVDISGGARVEVGAVRFETDGTATNAEAIVGVGGGATLVIKELDLTQSGVTLNAVSKGNIVVESLRSGDRAEGRMLRVDGADGANPLNLTLGSNTGRDSVVTFAGGLYLANGSIVTLAQNAEFGWLDGDITQELTRVGGAITAPEKVSEDPETPTKEWEARTLTLTSNENHIGSNYVIGEGVTLRMGTEARQTLIGSTIKGVLALSGESSVLTFMEHRGATNTISGSLTGTGTLRVQGGTDRSAALTWSGTANGFTGTLEFAGESEGVLTMMGSDVLGEAAHAHLQVGNLSTTDANGRVTSADGGEHVLTLNYVGEDLGSAAIDDRSLTLGDGITLEKAGGGTFLLQNVTGGKILVSGGTLVANAQGGGWDVGVVEVTEGGSFSAANGSRVSGEVQLSGGTLSLDGHVEDFSGERSISFGKVNVTQDGSSVVFGESSGDISIGELTGAGALRIEEGSDGDEKRVVVKSLKDYTGEITGTLNVDKDGVIEMGEGKESGRVDTLVVVGRDAELTMKGKGSFTVANLRLDGKLHMINGKTGGSANTGNLVIDSLTLGNQATLAYDKTPGNQDSLVKLQIDTITDALEEGGSLRLDVSGVDESDQLRGFCLGIMGDGFGKADDLYHKYFALDVADDGDSGNFKLQWGDQGGEHSDMLYLRLGYSSSDNTEYDSNWGTVAANENKHGPGMRKMTAYDRSYTGDTEEGKGSILSRLLDLGLKAKDFTGEVLSLSGTGTTEGVDVPNVDTFYENNGYITGIRLTKGAPKDEATLLSIVGGSVFRDGQAPKSEERDSFIVLRVSDENEADSHYYLLVGGSSCVSTTSPENVDRFVGFEGNSHLQVQGGTVDYLVGGNYVTNAFFGFDGDSFISVYDNNSYGEEGGKVASEVRGGIVGGSVITWSTQEKSQDFEGNSHIFIYTLLNNPEGGAPSVSDGTSEGATGFTAVVGGNVWIDVPSEKVSENIKPTFVGTTNIFVNLLEGKAIEDDTTLDANNGDGLNLAGTFDKAIVGGNYTVPEQLAENAGSRISVFSGKFDDGSEGAHAHITIYATADHTFTAGINGASRRDSAGDGATEFEGNTHVELHGGNYTNIVAGGMWYQAPTDEATSTHEGNLTGNTNVELFDGNFFRVAGGNVSLEGKEGSSDTFKGKSSVIIHGGTFGMVGDGEAAAQADIPFVAGGSFYSDTEGTITHSQNGPDSVLTELNILGGTFTDVHLVGGDYINTTGVDTQERGEGPTIGGNTQVVIGSAAGGTAQPEITGVVVGGSYLTDDGEGGSAIITGSTNVEINGGSIKAEVIPGGTVHAHGGLAVVAGSMLIDDGTTAGNHTIQIGGDTNLTINGGDITGFVVGGSYSSDSLGANNITIGGSVNMNLKGGTITGNIIGGHYSDNTENPDDSTLGNVVINVEGSTVHGLIFGGSFRRAQRGSVGTDDLQKYPQQGELTVNLTSGEIAGGVYAAGNHYNTDADAQLHVRTAKTVVKVTGDMKFTSFTGMTAGGEQVSYEQFMLSGGYQRNVTAGRDLEDYSTVGYDGAWSEGAAQLHFLNVEGADNSFANITQFAEHLRLQDFDAVYTDEGLTMDLSETVMRVMHKVAGTGLPEEEANRDSFVKQGGGDLVLKGLRSWNAQKYDASTGFVGTEEAYGGLIVVEGGHLVLRDSSGSQSLLGGLAFVFGNDNLRATGSTGDAYLRAEGGLTLSFAGASQTQKVKLQLRLPDGRKAEDLEPGLYRLASGIDWSTLEGLSNSGQIAPKDLKLYFDPQDGNGTSLAELFGDLKSEEGTYSQFSLEKDGGTLMLRVMKYSNDSWVWWGDGDGTWKNDSTDNWSRGDDAALTGEDDVHFYDGAPTLDGIVFIDAQATPDGQVTPVTPHNVYVHSGSYTFTEDTPGSLRPTGVIYIGDEEPDYNEELLTARRDEVRGTLELDIDGKYLNNVQVNVGGRLSLTTPRALSNQDTKIILNGGTLMYAEKDGALAMQDDLSDRIKQSDTKNAVLRIQVGNSVQAADSSGKEATARSVSNEEAMTVTWSGRMDAKEGISLGVKRGIIQSGSGVFHFVWDTYGGMRINDGVWEGTLRSREGRLVVEVTGGGSVRIKPNDETSNENLRLSAESDEAELQLVASNGTELIVSRGMRGSGTITIGASGSAEGSAEGSYTLDVTNEREKEIMQNYFTGTLKLLGDGKSSTVQVEQADTLGHGDQSTLALAGRALTFADPEKTAMVKVGTIVVEDNTTNMLGGYNADHAAGSNGSITLQAQNGIIGNGILANAQGGFNHTIIGSLSDFKGMLVAGLASENASGDQVTQDAQSSSWTLQGDLTSESSVVSAHLAGTGTIRFTLPDVPEGASADAPRRKVKVRLEGVVGDETLGNSLKLENAMGNSTLVLANTGNSSTGALIFNNNEIWLGDDDGTEANWVGKDYEGEGTFVLKSGSLGTPLTTRNTVDLKVETARDTGSTVNVNGTAGSMFKEIVINENGHLTGVSGPITVGGDSNQTKVTLIFTENNAGDRVGNSGDYLIQSSGDLVIYETSRKQDDDTAESFITVDFSNKELMNILLAHRDDNVATYLHLISGGKISFFSTDQEKKEAMLMEMLLSAPNSSLLGNTGFKLQTEGGDLVLYGSSDSVYLVLNEKNDPGQTQTDPHTISDPVAAANLSRMKATLVDEDTSLSLDLNQAGDVTVNNLVGLTGSSLSASGTGTVTLRNQLVKDDLKAENEWLDDDDVTKLKGQDTRFEGRLVGGEGVSFRKTGQGTLTVGDGSEKGGLDIAGDLQLRNGSFVVRAMDSHLGSLVFDYGNGLGEGEELRRGQEGDLVVQGGKLTVGHIVEDERQASEGDQESNRITLKEQAELVYNGESTLEHTTIESSDSSGLLTLGENASLVLDGGDKLKDVSVNLLEQSMLNIGRSKQTVNQLNGKGALKGGEGSSLTVSGGSFSGTLVGTGTEGTGPAGKLVVANGARFTLDNAKSPDVPSANAWDVQLGDDSRLKVDVSKGGAKLSLGDVYLGNGRMEVEFGDHPVTSNQVTANLAGVEKNGSLIFNSDAEMTQNEVFTGFTVSDDLKDVIGEYVSFTGAGNLMKDSSVRVTEDGKLVVTTTDATGNRFERAIPSAGRNARAGATMMWDSLKNKSQEDGFFESLSNPNTDYEKLASGLNDMLDRNDAAALERTLASVAGASIATLAPAFMEDIHRQLKTIRNRTTTMAGDVPDGSYNDHRPFWHAWISGEGGYHKLDADGDMPGFTLNSWGGTVGVDIDVSQNATLGMALSAMYGDLKPDSSESATGDLDTTYLNAFLRASSGAWIHTFVLSGGRADIGLDRTVNYGSGSYHTKGSTDGYALGALYEIGYTGLVNREGTLALQPVFNVEARHASIKGFSESNSDAGLNVSKMSQDIITFGTGARMQSVVGGRSLNRTSIFEARMLVKADFGDRSGTSSNAITNSGTFAEVESAEVGAVGVEVGAGITIPLGTHYGSIFMDASFEWRRGWTSADASVGYRVNF